MSSTRLDPKYLTPGLALLGDDMAVHARLGRTKFEFQIVPPMGHNPLQLPLPLQP